MTEANSAWWMPNAYDGKPIPVFTRTELGLYILYGTPVGPFLEGLLTNNLYKAVSTADPVNALLIREYVMWLNNNPSGNCWGSDDRVWLWQRDGGMVGQAWIVDPQYKGD